MIHGQFSQAAVEVLESEKSYQGFYAIETLKLRHRLFQGGWIEPITREVILQKRSVTVLLFDPILFQFVLIEQFRAGAFIGGSMLSEDQKASYHSPWIFEIVGGMQKDGESAESTARNETEEESGLTIQALLPIYEYWTSPADSAQRMSLFCGRVDAKQAEGVHGLVAEGENIRVRTLPVKEAYQYLAQGRIQNAHTLIALQWFQLNEQNILDQWKER